MTDPSVFRALRETLRPRLGLFSNVIHEQRVTCGTCGTPVDGFMECYPCANQRSPLTADHVASIVYAWKPHQSGYIMRGYKSPSGAVADTPLTVRALMTIGVALHGPCLVRIGGRPVTHWATVPSLPPKPGEHPLHKLVRGIPQVPGTEAVVAGVAPTGNRVVDPAQFRLTSGDVRDGHVLVLDDTWTSGSRAQSVAGVLKQAGASIVSILTVARWLSPGFGHTTEFIRERLSRPDYDPGTCPWTGGACP